jgi:hypothetical protein
MIGKWLTCALTVVILAILAIWGFNVHADRENVQELRVTVVEQCANVEQPKECGERVADALDGAF